MNFTNKHKLNPLTLKSDQHLISPYNITPESNMKVMRIKEMITSTSIKFFLSAPQEIYGESMENVHTDVRLLVTKIALPSKGLQ